MRTHCAILSQNSTRICKYQMPSLNIRRTAHTRTAMEDVSFCTWPCSVFATFGHTDENNSRICGNKMPTRRNRGFYCRSYCFINMFRAPLCPSSGAQEYYTVVTACGISCCGFQVAGLRVMCPVCRMLHHPANRTYNPQLQQLENHSTKYHRQQPPYNTLELLMMDIVVPKTC